MANFVSSAMVLQRRYPISQFRQTHGTKLVAIACEKGPTSHSSWLYESEYVLDSAALRNIEVLERYAA
jgi:hypothetical protein